MNERNSMKTFYKELKKDLETELNNTTQTLKTTREAVLKAPPAELNFYLWQHETEAQHRGFLAGKLLHVESKLKDYEK